MKISHEVPFCLLEKSREFNDYDYCLPHLLDQSEEYKNFFYKSKKQGRYIVMDNSLHELGVAYDKSRLLFWINELKPNEFIVPDVWEDKAASCRNAKQWASISLPEEVLKVAVVQAKSIHEAILCTQAYKDLGYKKIAYSYGASYYNEVCPHPNKDFGKAIGRFMVINEMYQSGMLSKHDRVHLLGTAWPSEFGCYKDIKCIESIDTSNPIMAGRSGMIYDDLGISRKPIANMNTFQDKPINEYQSKILKHNIKQFRKINKL